MTSAERCGVPSEGVVPLLIAAIASIRGGDLVEAKRRTKEVFLLLSDAVETGSAVQAASERRKNTPVDWATYDRFLGAMKDRELALIIGCSNTTVWARRQQLGVPVRVRSRLPEFDHLLGTVTDQEVADRAGAARSTVAMRRAKLGIEAHQPKRLPS